jgi:methyl-accepting chemotaxis protein
MSAAAQEVAKSAQNAAVAAQQTDEEGQAAKRVVAGSIAQIHALVDDIRSSGVSLDSLQQDVSSIVSVLGVIRSIAEQTNLLALNAAIEAARAGEAGRGLRWCRRSAAGQPHAGQHQEIQGMIDRFSAKAPSCRGRHAPLQRCRRRHLGPGQRSRGASLDTMAQRSAPSIR